MNVLLTNGFLADYRGSEIVTRDLALELRRQGHQAAVYSPQPGSVSDELRRAGVEVTDRLSTLSSVPDVIHGQHHPALEAVLYFPSAPGVFVAHGCNAFKEMPVWFPRILRYVAVDERVRKWIESFPDIPRDRVRVIYNAVDLERFQRRGPLPSKPGRALVFSNSASRATHVPAVRKACRRAGLQLDVVGMEAGNAVANPEKLLPAYDVVFAKARCALEALAVGSAVVLCDAKGLGPMVSSMEFDVLRRLNFGVNTLTRPLRPELIGAEIERYDPSDASAVCRRTRAEAGLTQAVEQWLALYTVVIDEFRGQPRSPDDELRALARHLGEWNFQKRVDWEREQLYKLKSVPVIGGRLLSVALRILNRMTNHWGLPGS